MKNRHLVAATALILALWTPAAHAWFFFFIPGSLISKVSDSITGAEGDICVKESAKVGDIITSAAGNNGVIKSTSGTSTRCQNKDLPIRAVVEFTIKFNSRAGIDMPDTFKANELSSLDRYNGWLLKAEDKPRSIGLYIQAIAKKPGDNGGVLAQNNAKAMSNATDDAKVSAEAELDINGIHAYRFVLTAKAKGLFGRSFTYVVTVLDHGDEFVVIKVWSLTSDYEKFQNELIQVASNIKFAPTQGELASAKIAPVGNVAPPDVLEQGNGISTKSDNSMLPPQVVTSAPQLAEPPSIAPSLPAPKIATSVSAAILTPTQPESGANSTAIAEKLRTLDQLRKEKLISEKDYEAKKQELLKSF